MWRAGEQGDFEQEGGWFAMKRSVSLLLAFLLVGLLSAQAAGFCSDTAAINEACQSVMKLEVKDDRGDVLGSASGFLIYDDRTLVTNCHVIEKAHAITAYSDAGEAFEIDGVLCANSDTDLAVLRFREPTGLRPLLLNEEGSVYRASPVVAIGSPKGFSNTVSKGNVSSVYTGDDGVRYIAFNAAISAGSSGGALLNDEGQVIGVTSAFYTGAAQNLNLAVNILEVIELYEAHKGEETTALSRWMDVNRGAGESAFPAATARSFTIKNGATFSISEVYLYRDGASNWGKVRNENGWLYKGSSMECTVTDEEADQRGLWTLNFCFYLNKRPVYMETHGIDLRAILGKTIVITIENGNQIRVDIEE